MIKPVNNNVIAEFQIPESLQNKIYPTLRNDKINLSTEFLQELQIYNKDWTYAEAIQQPLFSEIIFQALGEINILNYCTIQEVCSTLENSPIVDKKVILNTSVPGKKYDFNADEGTFKTLFNSDHIMAYLTNTDITPIKDYILVEINLPEQFKDEKVFGDFKITSLDPKLNDDDKLLNYIKGDFTGISIFGDFCKVTEIGEDCKEIKKGDDIILPPNYHFTFRDCVKVSLANGLMYFIIKENIVQGIKIA